MPSHRMNSGTQAIDGIAAQRLQHRVEQPAPQHGIAGERAEAASPRRRRAAKPSSTRSKRDLDDASTARRGAPDRRACASTAEGGGSRFGRTQPSRPLDSQSNEQQQRDDEPAATRPDRRARRMRQGRAASAPHPAAASVAVSRLANCGSISCVGGRGDVGAGRNDSAFLQHVAGGDDRRAMLGADHRVVRSVRSSSLAATGSVSLAALARTCLQPVRVGQRPLPAALVDRAAGATIRRDAPWRRPRGH